MHNVELILTLTSGLAAALVLGYVTHRLGLSPIVGYLLAGFAVGPNTPGFIANKDLADQLAEVGVILLMFGVGLQFHFEELLKVWRVAVPGAIGQSLVATLLGCLLAVATGWGWSAGLVFGLAISVASTVVLLRVLADHNDLHTPTGHIAVGWLVVEDLFTVLMLVLLPVVYGTGQTDVGNIALALGWSVLKLAVLIAVTFLVGDRLLPWLLGHVAATRSRELFTLTVLVLALGIAVGSALLFGASMALGAFLAGMVVGRSEFSLRAATEAMPMRDAFAVLFFVSVGMLFHPAYLLMAPGLVAAALGIILLAKPLAALTIVRLLGYPPRVAFSVAVALAQIGEFSFILAALGKQLGEPPGVLPESATNALVAAAIVSICLNPVLYRLIGPLEAWAQRRPRVWRWLNARVRARPLEGGDRPTRDFGEPGPGYEAIVVGYGPVGRTLTRLLRESGVEPTVVELNLDTVRRLQAEGTHAVYGDANHRETLRAAGVERAVAVVLTSAGMRGSEEVIRLAREENPKVRVFARTAYLREIEALRRAGADAVFSGEGEVALTMTEFILRRLGATEEQIDRERDRIHVELFRGSFSAGPLIDPEAQAGANVARETKSDHGPQEDESRKQEGAGPDGAQQEQASSDPSTTPPAQ
jgi:CPA2 family monovalent cation:H+ antiporter-2